MMDLSNAKTNTSSFKLAHRYDGFLSLRYRDGCIAPVRIGRKEWSDKPRIWNLESCFCLVNIEPCDILEGNVCTRDA